MNADKPSRLELYLEILRIIETLRSSNLKTIQQETKVEQAFLTHAMHFIEKQNLIQKERIENQEVYTTTPRGDRVANTSLPDPRQCQLTMTQWLEVPKLHLALFLVKWLVHP